MVLSLNVNSDFVDGLSHRPTKREQTWGQIGDSFREVGVSFTERKVDVTHVPQEVGKEGDDGEQDDEDEEEYYFQDET